MEDFSQEYLKNLTFGDKGVSINQTTKEIHKLLENYTFDQKILKLFHEVLVEERRKFFSKGIKNGKK